jgi:hypothetical protein
MKQKRSVIAYSFLAQTKRGEGDLLQGLTPIFKPIAKSHANEKFEPEEFARILDELYGIKVHNWAIQDLLPRLESAEIVYKAKISDDIEQYYYSEITEEFNEVDEKDIRLITQEFVEFSKPILESHNLPIDIDALEDAFLSQLVDMDFISILLKPDRSKEDSKTPKTISLKKKSDEIEWEQQISAKSKIDVLSASFIIEVYKTNQKLYELIMRVATGALLSEVILNVQDPQVDISLDGLTVILDTPFLMSLLDLANKDSHGFAVEICEQLKNKGATIATFEHSIEELQDNLKAVIERTKRGEGSGHTSIRLRERQFEVYANNVLTNTDLCIEKAGIGLLKNPTTSHIYQYFTEADQQLLESYLGYYRYSLARERDAKSISSVIRLRRGSTEPMRKLPSCGFLLITQNTSLVRKASDFCLRNRFYSEKDIPPALSEKYLSGLLWVLYGGKGQELTKHLLLANCAAALEPRTDIISKMHSFLSTSNEAQLELFDSLMTSERAGQYIMQSSLGDSSLINENNFAEILEKVKASLIEQHQIDTQKQIADLNQEFEHNIEIKQAEIEAVKRNFNERLIDKENEINSLSNRIADSKQTQIHLTQELEANKDNIGELQASINQTKKERDELIKKHIHRLIRESEAYSSKLKLRISLIIVLLSVSISFLLSFFDFHFFITAVLLMVVTPLTVWVIPDLLFSGYIAKKCCKYFQEEIEKLFITSDEVERSNISLPELLTQTRAF